MMVIPLKFGMLHVVRGKKPILLPCVLHEEMEKTGQRS